MNIDPRLADALQHAVLALLEETDDVVGFSNDEWTALVAAFDKRLREHGGRVVFDHLAAS